MTSTPASDIGWYSEEAATFGDRLAAARDAVGLSQEDLARRLGIKLKTIRAWEDDLSEPRANRLQMVAGILNVSIRWLLTGEGAGLTTPEPEAIPESVADLLVELRDVKGQIQRSGERVALIEKRLRAVVERGDL